MRWERLAATVLLLALASAAPPPASAPHLLSKFPDFGYLTGPGSYVGRTFRLSQDFPAAKPALDPAVAKILAIDFTKDWRAYSEAIKAYALEGNVHGGAVGDDFYLEDNKVRSWYHVPWQHSGPGGREGIHGLTAEATAGKQQLAQSQKDIWQAFAVGFYNAPGGWAIGQVWADPANPRPELLARGGFPVGTVVAKLLFTDAPVAQVPYLTNPIEWNGYVFSTPYMVGVSNGPPPERRLQTLRLIQMDVMVRDDRAKASGGWVFATYVYNGAMNRVPLWNNLVPVGLSWGNDPKVVSMAAGNPQPTKTIINPDLKQTRINPNAAELPPQHLGFGMRLSGPVDNHQSACQSCHMTAEFPQISSIVPVGSTDSRGQPNCPGNAGWMRWFQNVPLGQAFDGQALNTDDSLQMSASYSNFIAARAAATGGHWNVEYWNGQPVQSVVDRRGAASVTSTGCPQ
jgi:hypothetical protein